MRRRDFIALMGGGVAAWPLAARAAGPGPRIGVLDINSREYSERDFTAFRDGLQKLGYVEGKPRTSITATPMGMPAHCPHWRGSWSSLNQASYWLWR